jgi:putative RNA 2'-phosphotransferase
MQSTAPELVAISKLLSLVLRHKPDVIGLELDSQGWASVDELVRLAKAHGYSLTRDLIEKVVASSDKQRFAIDESRTRIRANQGHSIAVDLEWVPQEPPEILFHGTATRFIAAIRTHGLSKGERLHVHLSVDERTASLVGQRHGKPAVLSIQAHEMWRDGCKFYCSDNGVWLVEAVPAIYIKFPPLTRPGMPMGKLQALISKATEGSSPVLLNYSESLPEGIARHCGPEEVADLIAALDHLSAARDAHDAGDESWDGDASDDIWRCQLRYASLLPDLIARYPLEVAAGLGSRYSTTRLWIALAFEKSPARAAIPFLSKALETEVNDQGRQVLEAASRRCSAGS